MPLEDYLIPGEEVKFHSDRTLRYGGKDYEIVITNKRLLLYARRGMIFKNDDVVTEKLAELQGVKYKERGILERLGFWKSTGRRSYNWREIPPRRKLYINR